MKRFYCITCQKIKRVRTLPPRRGSVIHTFKSGRILEDVPCGECRRHTTSPASPKGRRL
jgi:hypothetical protein